MKLILKIKKDKTQVVKFMTHHIIKIEANTISLLGHRWNSKSHKNEL
jgi:hypothetical protein